MDEESICHKFQYGYCKYLDRCRKLHFIEVCENENCKIEIYNKRHPKICQYFSVYGRCKFQPWAYNHVNFASDVKLRSTVRILENALEASKAEVGQLTTLIKNICVRL